MKKLSSTIIHLTNTFDEDHKKLTKGVGWSLFGSVTSKIFTIFSSVLVARQLGPSSYGQYGMLMSTVTLFASFSGLGLGVTLTKYLAQYYEIDKLKSRKIIGLILVLGIISSLVVCSIMLILSNNIVHNELGDAKLIIELRLLIPVVMMNTIISILIGLLSGLKKFKIIAKITLVQTFILSILMVISSVLFGVRGIVISNLIVSFLVLSIYFIVSKKTLDKYYLKPSLKGAYSEFHVVFVFALPALLSTLMLAPVIWYGNVTLIKESNYEELGIFNAANQWKNLIMFIPVTIGNVLLPFLSDGKNKSDSLEKTNILLTWYVMILLAYPFILFPEAFQILYGDRYTSRAFIQSLAIASLVTTIIGYRQGIARKLASLSKMWLGVLDNLIWSLFFIFALFLFIDYGAFGLSLSYLVAYIINSLIFVPYYIKINIVKKDYVLSKDIIIIWVAIFSQIIVSLMIPQIILRLALSMINAFTIFIIVFKSIYIKIKQKLEESV